MSELIFFLVVSIKQCYMFLQVADCVCLMSLDKSNAVPIDTHVWQIAKRDYKFAPNNAQKSLTDKLYRDIGQCVSFVYYKLL